MQLWTEVKSPTPSAATKGLLCSCPAALLPRLRGVLMPQRLLKPRVENSGPGVPKSPMDPRVETPVDTGKQRARRLKGHRHWGFAPQQQVLGDQERPGARASPRHQAVGSTGRVSKAGARTSADTCLLKPSPATPGERPGATACSSRGRGGAGGERHREQREGPGTAREGPAGLVAGRHK